MTAWQQLKQRTQSNTMSASTLLCTAGPSSWQDGARGTQQDQGNISGCAQVSPHPRTKQSSALCISLVPSGYCFFYRENPPPCLEASVLCWLSISSPDPKPTHGCCRALPVPLLSSTAPHTDTLKWDPKLISHHEFCHTSKNNTAPISLPQTHSPSAYLWASPQKQHFGSHESTAASTHWCSTSSTKYRSGCLPGLEGSIQTAGEMTVCMG